MVFDLRILVYVYRTKGLNTFFFICVCVCVCVFSCCIAMHIFHIIFVGSNHLMN